jgi:glycosyltransferase involved in cell wall biosynthesis
VNTLLSINNYHYRRGGAEVVFLEQNRLFRELDWRVVPFSMRHSDNISSEWDRHFVDEIEFGKDYSLLQKAINAQKVTFSFESRRRIDGLLDEISPDIAHAHNVYHHLSPSIFGVLKRRGVPTVLTLHDLKIACPAYKMLAHDGLCERCKGGSLWNVVAHRCIKQSSLLSAVVMIESATQKLLGSYSKNIDRFIVPSKFYQEKLEEWGWPRSRFVHIPNFVDLETVVSDAGRPGNAFVYVGRLSKEKGVATFIRAVAIAGVEAWIVGTGPEEQELRELATQCGANVVFLGYRSGQELFDLIRQSRALVLPSEWYENAPMSVLEAYALERPVIGARIGGIPELIESGETGELFTSGDSDGLADLLSRFSSFSVHIVERMGKAGRELVKKSFTADRYRQRLLNLYCELGVTIK